MLEYICDVLLFRPAELVNMVLNVHRNHEAIRDGEKRGKGVWR